MKFTLRLADGREIAASISEIASLTIDQPAALPAPTPAPEPVPAPAPVAPGLTAAEFLPALLACKGGEELTVRPGEVIPGYTVRDRIWKEPVTIIGRGAAFERPHYWGCEGIRHIGGTFFSPAEHEGVGGGGYALWLRDCRNTHVVGALVIDAVKGLIIGSCEEKSRTELTWAASGACVLPTTASGTSRPCRRPAR
ncbi:hypothetical protein GCM10007973_18240 [Polymorphobacter multimanifer]|uniref:hypothetical protein n=1 Tax=Polymorphobacter multimanifer TaxID=1070431 RepID=UPI0019C857A8|nr:hypothetical protein [Polymorphobacter multimanifer]GGI82133.1 hypothetical protein GCM10007973_18240 [Polymorphobacter multimanifer]